MGYQKSRLWSGIGRCLGRMGNDFMNFWTLVSSQKLVAHGVMEHKAFSGLMDRSSVVDLGISYPKAADAASVYRKSTKGRAVDRQVFGHKLSSDGLISAQGMGQLAHRQRAIQFSWCYQVFWRVTVDQKHRKNENTRYATLVWWCLPMIKILCPYGLYGLYVSWMAVTFLHVLDWLNLCCRQKVLDVLHAYWDRCWADQKRETDLDPVLYDQQHVPSVSWVVSLTLFMGLAPSCLYGGQRQPVLSVHPKTHEHVYHKTYVQERQKHFSPVLGMHGLSAVSSRRMPTDSPSCRLTDPLSSVRLDDPKNTVSPYEQGAFSRELQALTVVGQSVDVQKIRQKSLIVLSLPVTNTSASDVNSPRITVPIHHNTRRVLVPEPAIVYSSGLSYFGGIKGYTLLPHQSRYDHIVTQRHDQGQQAISPYEFTSQARAAEEADVSLLFRQMKRRSAHLKWVQARQRDGNRASQPQSVDKFLIPHKQARQQRKGGLLSGHRHPYEMMAPNVPVDKKNAVSLSPVVLASGQTVMAQNALGSKNLGQKTLVKTVVPRKCVPHHDFAAAPQSRQACRIQQTARHSPDVALQLYRKMTRNDHLSPVLFEKSYLPIAKHTHVSITKPCQGLAYIGFENWRKKVLSLTRQHPVQSFSHAGDMPWQSDGQRPGFLPSKLGLCALDQRQLCTAHPMPALQGHPLASARSSLSTPHALDKMSIEQGIVLLLSIAQEIHASHPEKPTMGNLLWHGLEGMLRSLDAHSDIMTPAEFQDFKNNTSAEFAGLGLELMIYRDRGVVEVVATLDGTPARSAGIKTGDCIVAVSPTGQEKDKMLLMGHNADEGVRLMRGMAGTPVTLWIKRAGEGSLKVIRLIRQIIKLDTVVKWHMADQVAVLRVASFNEKVSVQLVKALKTLHARHGNKILGYVLDLRNNPGGLLDQAVKVMNVFVGDGTAVIIKSANPKHTITEKLHKNQVLAKNLPMVVLINHGSASASEIVAGGLQDHKRALIVGQRSYGKGSVQSVHELPQGLGALRLTVARFFTPKGRAIQIHGVEPDIVVKPIKSVTFELVQEWHENHMLGALAPRGMDALEKKRHVDSKDATPSADKAQESPIDAQLQRAIECVQIMSLSKTIGGG